MSIHDGASAPVTPREIADLLGEIRALGDGRLPASEHDRVMARKRALIERIQPGFYDQSDTDPAPDDQPGSDLAWEGNEFATVDRPVLAERFAVVWRWLDDAVPWGDHLATDEFLLRGRTAVRNLVPELRHLHLDSGGDGDA
jgi:hypothetical protein